MKNQTLDLLEKLLDAKLSTVNVNIANMSEDIQIIKKSINGNGRVGLLQRMDCVEDSQKNMAGKIGLLASFFGLIIAGMFEIVTRFFSKRIGL